MKKMTKSEAGKLGANKTHQSRYEAITELRKYVNSKEELDTLVGLPTKALLVIVKRFQTLK